ncbi:MAG: 50S ribosomal protein L9 [Alphaproteobacteria bacterium]|nr:50S ribosomal protein L9 [Alphaproteobacteria bacterium]MDP6813389.1 50S ribosomal protein L9 [Alphaproteobacteria bacterium]
MEVVLLERIERLGQMGDVVNVKNGYARNYLLPSGKALRASAENLARFEDQRADLEAKNLERRGEAEAVGGKMTDVSFVVVRQAGESGQLYGSVTARDVVEGLAEGGYKIERRQVVLDRPIKTLGIHEVRVMLHPEVGVMVKANVARSEEEAERQAAGEDVLAVEDIFENPEDAAELAAGDDDDAAEAEAGEASAPGSAGEAADATAEVDDGPREDDLAS